jgi:hypothetical protein
MKIRPRFSLRVLLVLFTIAGVFLAVVGQKVVQARKQRQLNTLAESFGGEPLHELNFVVGTERTIRSPNLNFSPTMPGPQWLRKRLGNEYFVETTEVLFDKDSHRVLDDAAFKEYCETIRANNLPFPQGLVLGSLPVTDKSLSELTSFPEVTSLHLHNCPGITNRGLQSMGQLVKLRYLKLGGLSIDDDGLAWLSTLTDILELSISGTDITDAGLQHLEPLRNLEYLTLSRTSVSVEGIKRLERKLPDCQIVY